MFQKYTWSYALSKAIEVRLDSFKMDNEYNCVYAYKIIELLANGSNNTSTTNARLESLEIMQLRF